MNNSSFSSIRSLRQLVQDEGFKFPLASQKLLKNILVDDIVTSVGTSTIAKSLFEELKNLCSLGHFSLRKIVSNAPEILSKIPQENFEPLHFKDPDQLSFSILGLLCVKPKDALSYQIKEMQLAYIKCGILSTVTQIYDTYGFLGPIFYQTTVD